jgi:hypothetical protein
MVLYDAKTKEVLGDGGLSMAKADDNNWYAFGVNVYQSGSLQKDVDTASRIPHGMRTNRLPTTVAFDAPAPKEPGAIRYASEAEEQKAEQ